MLSFLVSIVGIFSVHVFLSRIEIVFQSLQDKRNKIFHILTIPLYLAPFFKELSSLLFIYIGIFVLGLILIYLFFEKFIEIVVEKNQVMILDSLILNIHGGISLQKSIKIVYSQLNRIEKIIFEPLLTLHEPTQVKTQSAELDKYLIELKNIMNSSNKVLDQLKSYRSGLKLSKKFKTKVRQVTQQIRAQALVSILIYLMLAGISWSFLGLKRFPEVIVGSVLMLILGVRLIFKMGSRIKWNL